MQQVVFLETFFEKGQFPRDISFKQGGYNTICITRTFLCGGEVFGVRHLGSKLSILLDERMRNTPVGSLLGETGKSGSARAGKETEFPSPAEQTATIRNTSRARSSQQKHPH